MREKKAATNSWGNGHILSQTFHGKAEAHRAPRRYIELTDFQIEKSFRSVMHLNKGMEFRGGYYCRRAQPPSNQQQKGWRVVRGWWGEARFSPLRGPMAWCRGLLNVPCRIDPYDSLGEGEEKEARLALTQQRS